MKKYIFLVLLSLLVTGLYANEQTDSLLRVLDHSLDNREIFKTKKQQALDSLKKATLPAPTLADSVKLYDTLFKEYKHYNLDSALRAAELKKLYAEKIGDTQLAYQAQMNIAEMMGKMGIYKKTFEIMDSIRRSNLDPDQWEYYYHLYHSIYSLLLHNALLDEEKQHYKNLISSYKDSLLQVYDPNGLPFRLMENNKLLDAGNNKQALQVLEAYTKSPVPMNEKTAGIAFRLAETYEMMGDTLQQKKYLAIAAIADIRGAVKSYIALQKLAVLLYKEGDLERAYSYIKCAMEDATFAKARFRMIEISEALPIIVATYDKKMKAEKENLFKSLTLISILSVILLLSVVFIFIQLRRISATKVLIKNKNEELTQINSTLEEIIEKLAESDQVKEAYIGYVFNICSSYIDKLENYRLNLHKKLRSGMIEQALRDTGDSSLVPNEIKDFFQNFDSVFLSIYPRFIDEFNELLLPQERIKPRLADSLTPELRVFALIRMGITDSSKIATFLHYSPQTVYNYKRKIMKNLAVTKEDFTAKMEEIGR